MKLADAPASIVLTRHMPGLELLRGIAILAVIIFHGTAWSAPTMVLQSAFGAALMRVASYGWTAVNLFFTLSGFLITGNLLDSVGKENFYSRFYIRRALRIFPAYFLLLLVLGATHNASWDYLAVSAIFLANWPKLLLHPPFTMYGVLWSLAVEEQFYLAWPWLCRRFKGNGLLLLCIGILILCPVLRSVYFNVYLMSTFSKTFMIGDNLAVGAVIAILCRMPRFSYKALVGTGVAISCFAILLLIILSETGHWIISDTLGAGLGFSIMELLTGGLLIIALCGYRAGPVQAWLRFVVFFGDISYGLYLVHMLCATAYDHFIGIHHVFNGTTLLIRFVVVNGFAVLVATLSRRYFEQPIMDLRRRIPQAS